jgi:hypothetical protein
VVIAEFTLVPLLLIRRLRLYGMGLGFVLLFLHLLLMVHNFDILYAILILIVPLVACVPPDRFHALVSDQAAHVAPDESSTQAPQRPAHGALAALALVTMVLWSNVPPYRGHVLEEPRSFFSWPAWALHTPTRHSACDLRYYDMNRQNAIVERWKLLGYDHPGAVPKKLARVAKSNIEASNVHVCRSLRKAGDNPPRVKLFARCLVRDEWVKVYGAGSNLCSPAKTPNK